MSDTSSATSASVRSGYTGSTALDNGSAPPDHLALKEFTQYTSNGGSTAKGPGGWSKALGSSFNNAASRVGEKASNCKSWIEAWSSRQLDEMNGHRVNGGKCLGMIDSHLTRIEGSLSNMNPKVTERNSEAIANVLSLVGSSKLLTSMIQPELGTKAKPNWEAATRNISQLSSNAEKIREGVSTMNLGSRPLNAHVAGLCEKVDKLDEHNWQRQMTNETHLREMRKAANVASEVSKPSKDPRCFDAWKSWFSRKEGDSEKGDQKPSKVAWQNDEKSYLG
ncbi:uncharacterized protein L203_106456 [Cryptococcus depauperatus CBS 7841]|uniref:Uncharacterized protein n=1 Tax=Cryptococcus depauperatus CBS 7841 TaxID=1295531 RepID=A0A1E3IIW4_9TREE|nr:hypothetical protein L203_02543 [Cryptococcus depauperatus CBS 7841]